MSPKALRIIGTLGIFAGLIIGVAMYIHFQGQVRFASTIAEMQTLNNRSLRALFFWGPLIGIAFKAIMGKIANEQERGMNEYLGMCSGCLGIQLEGATIREFVKKEIFNEVDGKAALLFHLFEKNGCDSCKQKAKNHLQDFVNRHGIGLDVEKFYNNLQKRSAEK